MLTTASTVQTHLHGRRDKVFFRKPEPVSRRRLNSPCQDTASHPQQSRQVDAGCGCRLRIKPIANVDPRAHTPRAGYTGHKGERKRSTSAAFRTHHLRNRSHRQSSVQQIVHCRYARWGYRPDNPWHRRQCGRDAMRECRFDLETDCGGRRHGEYLRLIFALLRSPEQLPVAPILVQDRAKP
jgi:hypothetical protein